jgi:TRAP transporter 4TM/12TM fusion protein
MHEKVDIWKLIIRYLAVSGALYHIVSAYYLIFPGIQHRAIHICIGFILIWMMRPISVRLANSKIHRFISVPWIIITIVNCVYVFSSFATYHERVGLTPPTIEIVMGIILLLMVIDAARRVAGWTFPIITMIFVAYALLGAYLPEPFLHRGMTIERFISAFYITLSGFYGSITGISANYIVLFIIFAAFVNITDMGEFIKNISLSILGRYRGGSAKVAVVASSLMGTVSGSSLANVAGTGAFTIPLMKKVGYKSDVAGGIEASSSTASQLMPPIMGGTAFIMMELLGITYISIMRGVLLVAIIYYIGIFLSVDYHAVKNNLVGLNKQEIPDIKKTLKAGWFHVIPLIVLLYMIIIAGASLQRAGFWSIIAIIVVNLINKNNRLTLSKIMDCLEAGMKNSVVVIGLVGAASLIAGIVTVTGIGLRLSSILISLSGGNLLLLLILSAIASIILGMGLPAIVCYTLLAILVAPAIIELGVEPLAAHLFIFYYGVLSNITPPMAPAAFVASGIAEADPLKIAKHAILISLPIYLLPFLIVYHPVLMLTGSFVEILFAAFSAIIGVYAITSGIQGYILPKYNLNPFVRLILFIVGLLLLIPTHNIDIVLIAIVALIQFGKPLFSRVKKPVNP